MQKQTLSIQVEQDLSQGSEEIPKIMFLGSRKISVDDIIDRWINDDHRYYKIRGSDGGIYILCYDVPEEIWHLTLFDSGKYHATKLSST